MEYWFYYYCNINHLICPQWFFANYFYQLAFLVATVGVVNTLSSLSGESARASTMSTGTHWHIVLCACITLCMEIPFSTWLARRFSQTVHNRAHSWYGITYTLYCSFTIQLVTFIFAVIPDLTLLCLWTYVDMYIWWFVYCTYVGTYNYYMCTMQCIPQISYSAYVYRPLCWRETSNFLMEQSSIYSWTYGNINISYLCSL